MGVAHVYLPTLVSDILLVHLLWEWGLPQLVSLDMQAMIDLTLQVSMAVDTLVRCAGLQYLTMRPTKTSGNYIKAKHCVYSSRNLHIYFFFTCLFPYYTHQGL